MNGKNSFVLYCDIIHTVKKLPKNKVGELFLTILEYVNDMNPEVKDLNVDLVFEPIKRQLKRDLQTWLHTCEKNRENGKKGGRPKNPLKPKEPTALPKNPLKPKEPDIDIDIDTDIDTVNDNKKDIKKTDFIDKIVDVFTEEYLVYRDLEYIKSGKDKSAVGKLLRNYKKKNKDSDSKKTIDDFRMFFIQCLKITDKWYAENMDLSLINSKINEIRNILRKDNARNNEIRDAVNKYFD